ncbi:CPBP family glutamic-type intramembrane protease [Bacillus sp. B-jedd]|uniref:CPBP family glutamic-type intramembrane protease n=1 Tax=Bacillus sp. B-jedd TaxID=1476857 RepID=UPI00051572D1|nr:CPBP family glutamic-type intramembrane protease [Bacillus sp. B-jedd]CEG25669.1 CAAX amino terminal protease self-immunity [Bacillus sp. B-jedd]
MKNFIWGVKKIFSINSRRNRVLVLLSPLFIIGTVHLTTSTSHTHLSDNAWIMTALTYWGLSGLMIALFISKLELKGWLKNPVFSRKWLVIGLLIGIFPALGILLPNLKLLADYPVITLFLFLVALINPLFEEGYWRGLLLDAGKDYPRWAIILYSTFFFVLSHPLMWGVFSIANRSVQMYITLFIMGIVW